MNENHDPKTGEFSSGPGGGILDKLVVKNKADAIIKNMSLESKIKSERVADANEVAKHLQAKGFYTKVQTAGTGSVYLLIKDKPFDDSGGADVQHTIRYADHGAAPTNEAYQRNTTLSPEKQAEQTIKDIESKKQAEIKGRSDYEKDVSIRDKRLTEISSREKELATHNPGKAQFPSDWNGGNAAMQAKAIDAWKSTLTPEKRAAYDELQTLKKESQKLHAFDWRKLLKR